MPSGDEPIYFKAVLRPNPPLRPSACLGLLFVVAAMNLVIAVFFLMRGAWPVTPFMGADVLILAWAFSSTSKAATRREEVHLTRSELRVDLYPARGEPRHVALNPYWVRVQLDATPSGQNAITLATHGRKLQIGSFLALQDKASFVKALTQALSFARQAV